MIDKNKLAVFLFFMFAGATAFAQKDSAVINRNLRALQNYAAENPQEKVHLHLDRQLYFPGDTIWFKGYVVLGEYHKLSALSRVLYAELIDPKDSVINRITLGLNAGVTPGDFKVPFDATPGSYRIRAYTNYMHNAGSAFFYDQMVRIAGFSTTIDALNEKKQTGETGAKKSADKVDLQFFPEGGELINGLRSKVAFKAINRNGLSEEVQGTINDMDGNEVASFTTQHLGMGLFPLLPQKGKQYIAKVTAADGSTFTAKLPAAKESGFTLSVNNNSPDSLYLKVAANDELFNSRRDTAIYLIAQSGGKYYFAAGRKLADKVFTATIPKNRFPSGIVQFTLFSQAGEPLNERIVFIQNNDQLNLTINGAKQTYEPGENVKFDLEAKNQHGNASIGSFSVSVIDESRVPVNQSAAGTIFSDLLLKSELGGQIEDPNYYFADPNDQTRADLDLLMLTQGYHRFEWTKILAGGTPNLPYKPEKSFTISGTIKTPNGKAIPNGKVMLTSIKNFFVLDTLSDSNGRFSFDDINLPDTAKLIINAKKANGGNNVQLTIDKQESLVTDKNVNGYITNHFLRQLEPDAEQLRSAYAAWRQDSSGHVIQLKQVDIKSHKTDIHHVNYAELLKHSANIGGPGRADQVIMGDELVGCPNLATCLPSLLHGGIRIVWGPGNIPIFYSTHIPIALSGKTRPMSIMLDGIIVEQSEINMVNPSDVQGIELLESPMYFGIYGTQASGGLIIITTKYGDEINAPVTILPGLSLYKYSGFYKARQFYSPKYTAASPAKSDQRKTIYWNPAITTGADGKASFNYFNAGKKGVYRVVIEGIDGDGKLGRQVLTYNVTAAE